MDESNQPVFQYTVIDQYGVEHSVDGCAVRMDGKDLIIETDDGEKKFPSGKVQKEVQLPTDGPMPIFYNREKIGL